MPASVLVTDGEERSSLATVRSLGRAGYRVGVAARTRRPLAGASRHAAGGWRTPDPVTEPDAFVASIREIAVAGAIDVLLPMTEAALLAVLPRRDVFERVVIPFPSYDRFRAITDKARVAEAAREVGIGVPRQVVVERSGSGRPAVLERIERIGFPLVLKPARSVGEAGRTRRKVGVLYADTPSAYDEAVGSLPEQAFPLLVQQKIDGSGAGVFLLMKDGEAVARFAHRRIREKPPSGGVSVCRESVPPAPELVDASKRLLAAFGWEGVAMVEYKVDQRSGEPYIMEINPRFWGSLQLAIDAGVDFPRLLVKSALGEEVGPVGDYEVGVRTRWWWGEVDHFLARVKETRSSGAGTSSAREVLFALRELGTGWGEKTRSEVWSWSDPAPFIRETAHWLRGR